MRTYCNIETSKQLKRGWPTGYSNVLTPSALSSLKQTNTTMTIITVLLDFALIWSIAVIDNLFFLKLEVLYLPLYLITLLIIGRSQRGLECLVHEGSHYNWSRSCKTNDALVNLLAALPVFSLVGKYRDGHKTHHFYFGSTQDPDRQRYEQLDIDDLDRSSVGAFLLGMIKRLPSYVVSWWKAIRLSPRVLIYSVIWHTAVFILPAALLLGWQTSLDLWFRYWFLPLMLALPVIRFVGEAGEHIYRGKHNVFAATINNYGLAHKLIFHPHNDGYHLLHHIMPSVPHFNLEKAHRHLVTADPDNYGLRQLNRRRVLQEPVSLKQVISGANDKGRSST